MSNTSGCAGGLEKKRKEHDEEIGDSSESSGLQAPVSSVMMTLCLRLWTPCVV